MKMRKKLYALILSASMLIPSLSQAASVEYNTFDKLMNYAAQLYIDQDISVEELKEEAVSKLLEEHPELLDQLLKAGFSSLDQYSEFFTGEEFLDYVNDLNHTFYGIGETIQKNGEYVEVVNCLDGGSAKEAGLAIGDKIYAVDGESAVGKTLSDVQKMITGELNTTVNVTVLRGDAEKSFTLTRKPVSADTVAHTVLEGNIGYITIINFAEKTDTEFANVLKDLDEQGVTEIILDLRDNPGGYLISAVNIAKMIVPEGVIVQTMFRQEEKNETFYSELKNPKYRFAVLVNQNTASAAEVLAGAMQDSKIGYLIGDTTYGKAVIQEMFQLSNGGFKITTGHYLTRDGHEINKIGIDPDEQVMNTTQKVNMSRFTPFDYKIKWKVGEESDSVLAAKERLRLMGYYQGSMDTYFDTELESAVNQFQADTELYPYGVLDISTQVRIENEFYKREELVDNQLYTAYEYFGGDRQVLIDGENK